MTRVLIISVKPEFADKIFDGTKRIELRKSRPRISPGDRILIYSTLPEKALIGTCVTESIMEESPKLPWRKHRDVLGIDRKRYLAYYKDSNVAIGIALTLIERFPKKIPLDVIRKDFPTFSPPQTFKYFDERQLRKVYKHAEAFLRMR